MERKALPQLEADWMMEGRTLINDGGKIRGDKRRTLILNWLKESENPITGGALAKKTNVSRQVIVQDISLLKARNEPIVATAKGYMYIRQSPKQLPYKWVVAVKHKPEETEKELMLLVDHGVTVIDVTIEHPVYGDLTGSLMLTNRRDVEQFLRKINATNASLLSELTEGVHTHTIAANDEKQLQAACSALEKEGILLSDT